MRSPRRTMCAAVLGFECIVLALVTPVLISVAHVDKLTSFVIGLGLALSAIVISGLLRFEWGYYLGFALQVAALALGFLVGSMFILGVIFGALYATAYILGKRIEAQQAAHG